MSWNADGMAAPKPGFTDHTVDLFVSGLHRAGRARLRTGRGDLTCFVEQSQTERQAAGRQNATSTVAAHARKLGQGRECSAAVQRESRSDASSITIE